MNSSLQPNVFAAATEIHDEQSQRSITTTETKFGCALQYSTVGLRLEAAPRTLSVGEHAQQSEKLELDGGEVLADVGQRDAEHVALHHPRLVLLCNNTENRAQAAALQL